jgi:hypothetical protein
MYSLTYILAAATAIFSIANAVAAPEITLAPSPRLVRDLLKRQLNEGIDTCGWLNGDPSKLL